MVLLPKMAALPEALPQNSWDAVMDDYLAFLAYEHARQQRKQDKLFGQDDKTNDRMVEFEKLALLELMK